MSYDLFVFSAEHAPSKKARFLKWYENQTEWRDGRFYDDPALTTSRLQSWFMEIILTFPPMNGPLRRDDWPENDNHPSDYGINDHGIYIGFSWACADEAYATVLQLAASHQVGFFDVSDLNGTLWWPDGNGGLIKVWTD